MRVTVPYTLWAGNHAPWPPAHVRHLHLRKADRQAQGRASRASISGQHLDELPCTLAIGMTDRIFQFFSPSFDPSILDYCLAFLSGGCLFLRSTPAKEQTIGCWHWSKANVQSSGSTPSAMTQACPEKLDSCRLVMSGGETLPLHLGCRWASALASRGAHLGTCTAQRRRRSGPHAI